MKIIEAFNEEIEDNNYDLDQDIKFDSEEKIEEEKTKIYRTIINKCK